MRNEAEASDPEDAIVHDLSSFFERYNWPFSEQCVPLCIAHRGASGHLLENSIPAFKLAAELGARMWELDTQLTGDGVVVVSHDDHLQRVFGLDRYISTMTAAELANLGVSVPTFSEVSALAHHLGCGLYIELKAKGTGPLVWEELKRQGQTFACLASFDVGQVRELRLAGCQYPLAVLVGAGADPFALGDAADADILHLCWEKAGDRPQDLVTAQLLAQAFNEGREIVLWHEERTEVLADLIDLPVLGICTDLPERMRQSTNPST